MLINFMKRFAAPIRARTKRHTLRDPRKDGRVPKIGETLHLCTGLRRPGAERILDPPPTCSRVSSVVLRVEGPGFSYGILVGDLIRDHANGVQRGACMLYPEQFGLQRLGDDEARRFSEADGFATIEDFWMHWLSRGLPHYLHLIEWTEGRP